MRTYGDPPPFDTLVDPLDRAGARYEGRDGQGDSAPALAADRDFAQAYLPVARPITRLIIVGMALLTLSGVGWLFMGYRLTPVLLVKLILVAALWMLGPIIDKVLGPASRKEAPFPGEVCGSAFVQAERRYLMGEMAATGLFYGIVAMWVLS